MSEGLLVPDPLGSLLKRHCNVNGFEYGWHEIMLRELTDSGDIVKAQLFKRQLSEAITQESITLDEYEALTREDFDTQEDLTKWLKSIWKLLYGDDPFM
jgi:hypothetical protein